MENRDFNPITVAKKKHKMAKKKFTVPKVKVEKQAFDRVLAKLINAAPVKRAK